MPVEPGVPTGTDGPVIMVGEVTRTVTSPEAPIWSTSMPKALFPVVVMLSDWELTLMSPLPIWFTSMPEAFSPVVVMLSIWELTLMSPLPEWVASMPSSYTAVVLMVRFEVSISISSVEAASCSHTIRSPAAGVLLHTAVVCACASPTPRRKMATRIIAPMVARIVPRNGEDVRMRK